jgi:hypothetical protein
MDMANGSTAATGRVINWQTIRDEWHQGYSERELAKRHGLARSSIYEQRIRHKWADDEVERPKGVDTLREELPTHNTYDEDSKKFFAWLGKTRSQFRPKPGGVKTENTLVMTDVHIPYEDSGKVVRACEEFLAEHGSGSLVLGGDLLDGYSLNSYGKFKESSLKQEMARGREYLEYFSSIFEHVYLIDDNHLHGRWQRWVAKNVAPDMQHLLMHPYDVIVRDLPNVEHVSRTYANGAKLGWFLVLGDAMICHAETHSGIPMRPVNKVSDWVDTWGKTLGLPEIRCCLLAHVHKIGSYILPGKDRLIMETGCMVSWEGVSYSMGPECKYKPIVQGVIHLIQENGRTDFNRTKFVYMGD